MNETKLAILRDMSLNNNGYAAKMSTISHIGTNMGLTLSAVNKEFTSLVEFGHLKLLGKAGGREFYCLPENYNAVMEMMAELTGQQ